MENKRPQSIILIRLRQRPTFQLPSWNNLFQKNPTDMFQQLVKQFNVDTEKLAQSTDVDRASQLKTILELARRLPTMRLTDDSSEEGDKRTLIYRQESRPSFGDRLRQWFSNVRSQWNNLVSKQPNMPIWIVLALFLSLSAMFWCKYLMSLDER
jgi:hypothetical protein